MIEVFAGAFCKRVSLLFNASTWTFPGALRTELFTGLTGIPRSDPEFDFGGSDVVVEPEFESGFDFGLVVILVGRFDVGATRSERRLEDVSEPAASVPVALDFRSAADFDGGEVRWFNGVYADCR